MAQPTIQQALDQAIQHHQAGRLRDAEQIYQQILQTEPQHVFALHNLGVLSHQTGQNDLAVKLIRQAIQLKPEWRDAHANLAKILRDTGRFDEAIASYRHVILLAPALAEAHNNLAAALIDKGELDEGIAAMRRAVALRPDSVQIFFNLALALKTKKQFDQAIAACRHAISLKPDFAEAYHHLGLMLMAEGELDEAIAACRRAVALKPDYADAHNDLAGMLAEQCQFNQAILASRQAIALRPDFADAHQNLSSALINNQQIEEGLAAARQAIALRPDYAEPHINLAAIHLLHGEFTQGWREYEWRWQCQDFSARDRARAEPRWDGSLLQSRTILLHTEQGFGDAIQFVRYLPLVAERGGKIILECQHELQRLFQSVGREFQIVARGESLPPFDVHCPLLSLPGLFATTLASIPKNVPYLHPEPPLLDAWRQKLGPSDGRLRIGLNWAGNPGLKTDRIRSLNLQQLAPFAPIAGAKFYSLQKGPPAEQAKNPPLGLDLIDLAPELKDFADTAAVISLLDLVISVDTAVIHLAGALGKPAWLMLPFMSEWRWLLDRADSPWYPSLKLFRQSSPGNWDSVIKKISAELSSEINPD